MNSARKKRLGITNQGGRLVNKIKLLKHMFLLLAAVCAMTMIMPARAHAITDDINNVNATLTGPLEIGTAQTYDTLTIESNATLTDKGYTLTIDSTGTLNNYANQVTADHTIYPQGLVIQSSVYPPQTNNGILNNYGTLNNRYGGILTAGPPGGSLYEPIQGALNNYNILNNNSGALLQIGYEGILNNSGTLTNSGALVSLGLDSTLNNGISGVSLGILINNGELDNGGWLYNNAGSTLTNNSVRAAGFGWMNNEGYLYNYGDLENYGTLGVSYGASLNNGGTVNNNLGGTLTNYGTQNNGISGVGGGMLNNSGDLENYGKIINNSGTLTNNSGGTLTNTLGGTLLNTLGGTLTNSGTLTNLVGEQGGRSSVHSVYPSGGTRGRGGRSSVYSGISHPFHNTHPSSHPQQCSPSPPENAASPPVSDFFTITTSNRVVQQEKQKCG
jgi:hypothetical protein